MRWSFSRTLSLVGRQVFDVIRENRAWLIAYDGNSFFARGGAIYTYSAFSPENESAYVSAEQEIERIRKDGVTMKK